jgi:hypothetical protein
VYGNQYISKWSLPATCSSSPASTSASFSGRSSARSVNASTQRSVSSVTTPSAPTPTRAAANTSGFSVAEQFSTVPVPVTSVSASMKVARQPSLAPVPWVPVDMAPETVCTSMSPRFGTASPCSASRWFSTDSGMPACTVTSRRARSTETRPASPSSSSRTPSVAAAGVKECPEPTGLTVNPSSTAPRTAATTPSVETGRTTLTACARSLPAQLDQTWVSLITGCTPRGAPHQA